MEAELRQVIAPYKASPRQSWRDVVFTVGEARRALPYVARLAADAADAFRIVNESREALGQISAIADRNLRRTLCEQRDRALRRLDSAIDDCEGVGAHLVDIDSGLVCLPGEVEDRSVCLLWRVGQDIPSAWSDLLTSQTM